MDVPLGLFVAITGVSGGGKSTLMIDTMYQAIARRLNGARVTPAPHNHLTGLEFLDKVIDIDQSPIGRTPRSNPATYTGAFTPMREWFAGLPEAKARGYGPGRFSFNVKGGRCEKCEGDGVIKIEMHFLPDVYVTCEVCKGHRYNRETLEVQFKGKSIADVLDMTIDEAVEFFAAVPSIRDKFATLQRVGLGYVKVGQPATTLSGGEAQRVKLSKELCKRATGRTLYMLDEPTTGLHFHDIAKLLEVLHELVDTRQLGGGHRAQSRSHQDRRLDHRHGSGRRRWWRRGGRHRHARGHRRQQAVLYRQVPQGSDGAASAADSGGGVTTPLSHAGPRGVIERFVAAANAFEVDAALALFAADAAINDVSVGETFTGTAGVRRYLEQFFVGYHTVSRIISVDVLDEARAKAHLDFTGDFGHETGVLDVTINDDGRIATVAADLD